MSRFQMALKEVRGGVRSYSSVVKTLTDKIPDKSGVTVRAPKKDANSGNNNPYEADDDGKCIVS